MKVTNELNRYIYGELQKQSARGPEYEAQCELNYQAATEELLGSTELRAYHEACDAVNAKARALVQKYEGVEIRNYIDKYTGGFVFRLSTKTLTDEASDTFYKILAQLSCAKNQAAAREILKEYNIDL